MGLKKIFSDRQIWKGLFIILALSVIMGLVLNAGLVKRFFSGEFKQGFIKRDQLPGLAFITLAETEDLWSNQQAVIVDSRPAFEFKGGHIPGAISVPLEEVKKGNNSLLEKIPRGRLLVIYCEGGDCLTSLNLAKILHDHGFPELRVFSGGWEEWVASGLPVEKTEDNV
ncbi:MAG: rhodanese-like domain-containing protein [Candidatus Saccharicenans sp.]